MAATCMGKRQYGSGACRRGACKVPSHTSRRLVHTAGLWPILFPQLPCGPLSATMGKSAIKTCFDWQGLAVWGQLLDISCLGCLCQFDGEDAYSELMVMSQVSEHSTKLEALSLWPKPDAAVM